MTFAASGVLFCHAGLLVSVYLYIQFIIDS
jgi:hypothetical protein